MAARRCAPPTRRAPTARSRRAFRRDGRSPPTRSPPRATESGHPMAISLQRSAIPVGKSMTGDLEQRLRRQIEQDRSRVRHVVDRRDPRSGDDLAAERSQVRRQRVRELLGTAARNHPARDVRERVEHQSEACGKRSIERQHAVRAETGEESARSIVGENAPSEAVGRSQRTESERGHREWMARQAQRSEHARLDSRPRRDNRRDQIAIRLTVSPESIRGLRNRSEQERAAAVVERMREARWRIDPFEPVLVQRPLAKHI